MNKRDLIRELLQSLAHDEPMHKVMMLAQAVSFELYNKSFSEWVRKEQRGYLNDNEIPQYREVSCVLKADIFIPFRGILTNYPIPPEIIQDKNIRKVISSIKLPQSLSELEQINKQNNGGQIQLGVPGTIFPIIDQSLQQGNVQRAYRAISATVPSSIINIVKAKMLDFFSCLNRDIDLDLDFQEAKIQDQVETLFKTNIWNG